MNLLMVSVFWHKRLLLASRVLVSLRSCTVANLTQNTIFFFNFSSIYKNLCTELNESCKYLLVVKSRGLTLTYTKNQYRTYTPTCYASFSYIICFSFHLFWLYQGTVCERAPPRYKLAQLYGQNNIFIFSYEPK